MKNVIKTILGSYLVLFFVQGALSASLSEALDGLTKTSFGRESRLAIGDTVDVLDSTSPLERCISYDSDQVVADSEGSVFSNLSYKFVRDLNQFENTFKLSYSVEANASANFAKIMSGESTLKSFGSFENFLKRDSESVLIVIEAKALHGRDFVRDYGFKPEYKKLLDDGKFSEFRNKCGTHFVRGWNRKSSISIFIEISNLDQEAKFAIENTTSASFGGSVGISDVLSGSAKTSISTTISDTLRLAEKVGKVSARIEAVGGAGIGTVSGVLASGDLSDPAQIERLLSAIASKAADFSYANSSPDQFILVQHPQLNSNNVDFDEATYEKLGKIYSALIRVDQRAALYADYKGRDRKLWERYFRIESEKISALRKSLVNMYRSCRSNGQCDGKIPSKVDGLILDSFFENGKLEARCNHAYEYEDRVNGQIAEKFRYLSSIALVWKSDMNFLKNIDVSSAEAFSIPPSFKLIKLRFSPEKHQDVRVNDDQGKGRIFAEIHRESVVPSQITKDGEISIDAIRAIRKSVAQSVFTMKYQTVNGYEIEQTLGRPVMKKCPVYISE